MAKKAMSKAMSLVEQAKTKSTSRPPRSFLDKVPPELRDQLLELKRAFLAGELIDVNGQPWNASAVYRELIQPGQLVSVNCDTFRKWLNDN